MNETKTNEAEDHAANDLPKTVGEPSLGETSEVSAWEKLWIEAREKPWTTLAVVPGAPGHDVRPAAHRLAEIGRAALAGDVIHEAAEDVTLETSHALLERMDAAKAAGMPTIVSLGSPLTNRAALLTARHADATLLVVPLERCPLAKARKTVSEVGIERFVGTLVVRAR